MLPKTVETKLAELGFVCVVKIETLRWSQLIISISNSALCGLKIDNINSGCGVMIISGYSGHYTKDESYKKAWQYLLSLNKCCYITTLGTVHRLGRKNNEKWQSFFEELGFEKLKEYDNPHPAHTSGELHDKQAIYFLNPKNE